MDENKLLKISSFYTLKDLFTFADYNTILRLIKYNKFFLNKLDINSQNYRIATSYQYIKIEKRKKIFLKTFIIYFLL